MKQDYSLKTYEQVLYRNVVLVLIIILSLQYPSKNNIFLLHFSLKLVLNIFLKRLLSMEVVIRGLHLRYNKSNI